MIKHKLLYKILAIATMFPLCLSLLFLFPLSAHTSGIDEPYSFSKNESAPSGLDNEEHAPDLQPSVQQDPEEDSRAAMSATEKQDDRENDASQVNQHNDEVASLPPTENVAESGAEEPSSSENDWNEPVASEGEPEEPLVPDVSSLVKSSRTVPGYNVFEVDSFDALSKALRTTSYPSEEYPETSVYILLTGDISIETGFELHASIEKLTIDGDGQHTLSEVNLQRTQVSRNTVELTFKDLRIIGNQYYGLFDNPFNTNVIYNYERISYTGPQLLHAFSSTAHFTDCDISITKAGRIANEVAEIQDVYIHGSNKFRHNSTYAVFKMYNNGTLVVSHDAELHINTLDNTRYVLEIFQQSTLRLEDRAFMYVEGKCRQLANGEGLYSIFLGDSAMFNWEATGDGGDYIAVNNSGGTKDAIYLSESAEFRVAPTGTVNDRLVRINGGNVVVGDKAKFIIQSDSYATSINYNPPFSLAPGKSLSIGNGATLLMEIENSKRLSNGLLNFGGGAAASFVINRDATVVLRCNQTPGAVFFGGSGSRMEITAPNYLEIAAAGGVPLYFGNTSLVNPCTLRYIDVQQINYWDTGSGTYLNGAIPVQRWLAETGSIDVSVEVWSASNTNVLAALTDGTLDSGWTSTLDSSNFTWNNIGILSAGKLSTEISTDGTVYQGRLTAPTLGVPYSQGAVQLRVGQPGIDQAVSSLAPATPEFHVSPNQAVDAGDEISLWAEYGYVFHHSPPASTSGTLSMSVPDLIQFGTLPVPLADMDVSAQGVYALHILDERGPGNGWQVMASFSGFRNPAGLLNSTLVLNNVPLGETPLQIVASTGSETVPLEARLLVPGGSVEAGTYTGTITWTLVDAP